jgi:anti-sigma regulatory factor (Ser/Thr protein kinase)
MESFAESAEVIVSELVTNAVLVCREMTPGQVIGLWLVPGAERVLIVVWDASLRRPVRSDANAGAEGGRGLLLVHALSQRWGWRPAAGGGKFVWAIAGGSRPAGAMAERDAVGGEV